MRQNHLVGGGCIALTIVWGGRVGGAPSGASLRHWAADNWTAHPRLRALIWYFPQRPSTGKAPIVRVRPAKEALCGLDELTE
jgi:hypothetical protein